MSQATEDVTRPAGTTYAPGYWTPLQRIERNFEDLTDALHAARAGNRMEALESLESVRFSLAIAIEDIQREVRL